MKTFGTAVPVSALKTKKSAGCGEFLDLIPFADFCKKSGFSLIQILPVNDTGTGSSPYSALSAFALNPIYLSVGQLPELQNAPDAAKELKKFKKETESLKRFNYSQVRWEKIRILRAIYEKNRESIATDAELSDWIGKNPWVHEYALFMHYKDDYMQSSWKSWPKDKCWRNQKIEGDELFYAWIQMHLDRQFAEAAAYVREKGLKIKGDIPIMMNEDSHDAWAHPEFFNDALRAGSPVDGFNPVGQNWGFPTYNWKNLAKVDYSWWKKRLETASKYYDVYRIDHILGFFRIWAIPYGETTAVLGHTEPFEPITRAELNDEGFTDERIRWLSRPHIPTNLVEAVNNGDYLGSHGILRTVADRIGDEELWLFNSEISCDSDIYSRSDIPDPVKQVLAEKWRDRMLIEVEKDKFYPVWTYTETTAWKSLDSKEQEFFKELFAEKNKKMEYLWEKQARTVLGELTGCTDMIPCAEDLGANIDCLPSVLHDLNIQRLKVVRWSRLWDQPGQPFEDFADYPVQSVTTTSVHDSSTLRLWWLNEPDAADFAEAFCPELEPDGTYAPETAERILSVTATSASTYIIHPIQDYLALSETYYDEDPEAERINVPGSVNDFNWTYRLPALIEDLNKDKELCAAIKALSKAKKSKGKN